MKLLYKFFIFVLCVSVPAVILAQTNSSKVAISEARELYRVRQDFFNSIATADYQGIRNQCAPDFQLLEDGEVMTVEDLISLIRSMADRPKIVYSFEELKTKIEGANAWISYRNRAVVTRGEKTSNIVWLESAVFKKRNGMWKMVLLHSTRVKPKN